ncbi:nuclear transport factor 2 family protein [Paracoccus sediminicola]|uniref:nuclear transport factor 2 family protein n=1 Tax=Paracoccus sediminicola TaxID=3017783 RepID=UPI0022F120DA|nr:nuclear transport factor 2 family protein [Paracoccus sediminicola]WBU58502.1 nuclear transport factor 2 family protein [Paracoccus sediminicola]
MTDVTQSAAQVTQAFLAAVFSDAMETAMALVSPDAVFVSTNPRSNPGNPMHGTFTGHDGAAAFFAGFAEVLEPGDFDVIAAFGDETHAALYGTLAHTVRATGRPFVSDWALITRVEDGKIALYHFYEDTEALTEAMR